MGCSWLYTQQDQEQGKTAAAQKAATTSAAESKETDIERKKREADELLKGIIPDDVIDGTAGLFAVCFYSGTPLMRHGWADTCELLDFLVFSYKDEKL